MKKTVVFFSVFLFLSAGSFSSRAQQVRLMGFISSRAEKEVQLENRLPAIISTDSLAVYHRAFTAEPHHAGTRENLKLGNDYANLLRRFGFDEVRLYRYKVLLPRPVERVVELVAPERVSLKLAEPPLAEDPDTRKSGVLPTFNAYSADGEVTAEVVYVNYGIPEDYAVLDSLGISVKGKIVLARYGHSWRGIKPRLAAARGAVGCLIYSDPADDGYAKGDVLPRGKWRPEYGVQRGSVMDMPLYPGDPQTPGYPSTEGAKRIPLEKVKTLQKIPVLPLSYGDALPILRHLGGDVVPSKWRGALPVTYHFGPGPATVHLKVRQDWSVRPILNVVGILRGREEPDKLVMAGSHRDAWTFGGRDPISGAVSLLETARALGTLARQGNRPRRSIAIVSWDAEEYGLLGSTEYGEELGKRLQGNLVVYLNRESYTAGNFHAGGVHSLEPFVNELTRFVNIPGADSSIFQTWLAKASPKRIRCLKTGKQVRLSALGSGSDYTVFLDHLGIPALNFGFSAPNGVYHSRYDTHWFFTTFGDPGFRYGKTLANLVARFLLRMANADVLPFDYSATAETIDRYLKEVTELAKKKGVQDSPELASVAAANRLLGQTAAVLNAEIARILRLDPQQLRRHRKALQRLNQQLLDTERAFLLPKGLPGRPWFRHAIYAPGYYTGYGVKTLPGVREALENGRISRAKEMAKELARVLHRAQQQLLAATVTAASIR